MAQVQWNLLRQLVFHDRENKHDSVNTMPDKWWNLCSFTNTFPVSFLSDRLYCIWNVSLWKTMVHSTLIANTMATDDLVMWEASPSAFIVLSNLSQNILVSAPQGLREGFKQNSHKMKKEEMIILVG